MGSEHSPKPSSEAGAAPEPSEPGAPAELTADSQPAPEPTDDAGADADAHRATEAAYPSDPGEWSGRVLDQRYRVLRVLGQGGMGAVFVAEHLTLHKPVALKVVRAELAGNGEVAARFAREAMATAQFEHPHVASAIDYGTLPEGGAYFVMQLVRGRSLRRLLASEKRLPWRRVCEIAAQVADALSAAKAAGIIHRDLKPDNVLVERREDGSDLVKVLDFGIAHVAPRDAAAPPGAQAHRELTRVGTVMGTPGYMSPEQAVGDRVDHRTDLYALGVVIWECIAGRELWDGPDLTTVVSRQMTEPVPRLRDAAADPSVPAELDELVQRLTARAAAVRPEHAAEVRDTLRRLSHARAVVSAAQARALLRHGHAAWQRARSELQRGQVVLQRALARYRAQPRATRRWQAGGAVAVLLLFAVLGAARLDTHPGKQPTTMLAKVARVAAKIVPKAGPPPPPEPAIPEELAPDVQTMLGGRTWRERRAAAEKVLAYKPPERVFPHLLVIAELETARGCRARREALDKIKEQADPRYLTTLRRFDRLPHSGCGFLSLGDCYSCTRSDVRAAIDAIERAQAAKATAKDEPETGRREDGKN